MESKWIIQRPYRDSRFSHIRPLGAAGAFAVDICIVKYGHQVWDWCFSVRLVSSRGLHSLAMYAVLFNWLIFFFHMSGLYHQNSIHLCKVFLKIRFFTEIYTTMQVTNYRLRLHYKEKNYLKRLGDNNKKVGKYQFNVFHKWHFRSEIFSTCIPMKLSQCPIPLIKRGTPTLSRFYCKRLLDHQQWREKPVSRIFPFHTTTEGIWNP